MAVDAEEKNGMLVLSRKAGEWICIGDKIRIRVAEIGSGRVRLAIDTPRDISVIRAEIRDTTPGIIRPFRK